MFVFTPFWIRIIILKLIRYFSVTVTTSNEELCFVLHYTLPVQFATSYQDSPLIWTIKPRLGAIACVTGAKREWGGRGKIRERKGKGSLPSLPKSSQSPSPFDTCHGQARPTLAGLLGSFSNDDGDRNEDGKKAIGLDWQNNNFARASRFFTHFFVVAAWLQSESA